VLAYKNVGWPANFNKLRIHDDVRIDQGTLAKMCCLPDLADGANNFKEGLNIQYVTLLEFLPKLNCFLEISP
jgi:hypothetical protein